MPDYSACVQGKCDKKNKCARYLMMPGERQSYIKPDDWDECDAFWDVKDVVPFKLKEAGDD
jgi:hypothetical protein